MKNKGLFLSTALSGVCGFFGQGGLGALGALGAMPLQRADTGSPEPVPEEGSALLWGTGLLTVPGIFSSLLLIPWIMVFLSL